MFDKKIYLKEYYRTHKEKSKEYNKLHRAEHNERNKKWYINNIEFLKEYLEKQFDHKMNWVNYGSYWHVDHKIACALYDFNCPAQQFMCFNYINLRPLEGKENISKGKKSIKEFEEYKRKI